MTTSARLLTLLSLLQTRRDWPGQLLADRLEISHRTVRRDVDRLREMGYRIRAAKGPDGGYRLEAGSELPPLLFDDDQVVALAVALQAATATGVGIEEDAVRALATVRQVMPSRLRHRLDALQFTTMPVSPIATAPELLITLSVAVRARDVLRFEYRSSEPSLDPVVRRVEPHHLVSSRGRWYLVGWDLDREDWRMFRADRIDPRTPTGPRFMPRELPGGSVTDFVPAHFKGSDRADRWTCNGSAVLDAPVAEVRPYVGDGSVEELGPDRCRLQLGSWSWTSLAASFGRFDADIHDVRPAELRAAMAGLATRYAAASGDSG